MTVGLTTHYLDKEKHGISVPIAAQTFFSKFWKPAYLALHLTWVPQFENGITIEPDDVPSVVNELLTLRSWASEHYDQETADFMATRIDNTVNALCEFATSHDGAKAIIG